MVTVNVSTIGSGGDYATIALWEAATDNDLVALDRIEVGELLNQTHTITTQVQIIGATTDATRYRILRAQAGAEYDLITDTGAKVVMEGDGHVLLLSEQGSRVCDIGLFLGGNAQTTGKQCLRFTADTVNSHGAPCYVERVVCGVDGAADQDHAGVRAFANSANLDAPIVLRDCIVVGNGTAGNNFSRGFDTTSEGANGVTLDNCLAYGCKAYGIYLPVNSSANTARNCVSVENLTGDYQIASSGTNMNLARLASSDATATGPGAVTGIKPHRAFIAYPLNDFRPQADGPLHQAGVNLSSSFTQDITQNAYGAKWNIGPYGQSVRNGNSRANDTRILQVVFASGVDWAFIDTRGYDYMLIYPIGGVGTDPTSGTITFGAFAVDSEFTVSDITDPGERAQWASMPNIAGIHRQATMTSTAVNFGYMKVLPTRTLLWASGGSGWSNVPVRVELHKASEHWTEAGRG